MGENLKNFSTEELFSPDLPKKGLDVFIPPSDNDFPAEDDNPTEITLEQSESIKPSFIQPTQSPYIYVDSRETASPVTRILSELGIYIILQTLPTADYVISERCGIERKAIPDFVASIKDGRLFDELKRMKRQFNRSFLILEGDLAAEAGGMNRNALLGTLTSVLLKMDIGLIQTHDAAETAEFLVALAKKEQKENPNATRSINFKKVPEDPREELEYLLASISGINLSRAQDILNEFGSIMAIFNATIEELQTAPNIGPKLARKIYDLGHRDYFSLSPKR